ncbi:hypothetical protein COCOBI_04-1780 [Coccomyxa sp. Obi]|nr:hypothetical protein COCOBI_04-1780 [Coccomyxa sp. Obi]
MGYRMLAGLFLLAVVPAVHGLYGYAQAESSIGNVLITIRITTESTGLHQEAALGNPNGARFGIWLDEDCTFTANKSGRTVFATHGPAILARDISFDWMAVDCANAEQLPEYKPAGEDVFAALAYGGFIPYGSIEGLAKRGEAGNCIPYQTTGCLRSAVPCCSGLLCRVDGICVKPGE